MSSPQIRNVWENPRFAFKKTSDKLGVFHKIDVHKKPHKKIDIDNSPFMG